MRKVLLGLGVASLMTGTAMAAEPLSNQQMDKVTAGSGGWVSIAPIERPTGLNFTVTITNTFPFPGIQVVNDFTFPVISVPW